MRQSIFLKNLIVIFISVYLVLLSSSLIEGDEYKKTRILHIRNRGKQIGKVTERIEHRKNLILYKKEVNYLSGKCIKYDFTINDDFSTCRGEMSANGVQNIRIDNGTLTILKKGANKEIKFGKGVLPSNLIQLYIHELLRGKQQLPSAIDVIFEITGDRFKVDIKNLKFKNFHKIVYNAKKFNLNITETYFPDQDSYCVEAGNLYFTAEKLKEYPIWESVNDTLKTKKNVIVPPGFNGFFEQKEVRYRLTFSSEVPLRGDSRQSISKGKSNNKETVYYLKISHIDKIKDKTDDYNRGYENYPDSFTHLGELKKLGVEVSARAGDRSGKIARLLAWIGSNISLEDVELIEPYLVFKEKKGECQGICNLFLAMCSGIEIKGHAALGFVILNGPTSYEYALHQWVELWDGESWRPYDPVTGTKGIGVNYIKLFNLKKRVDLLKLTPFLNITKIEIL